jgi:hypothetical protein
MALKPKEIEGIAEAIARESLFQYFFAKKRIATQHILLKHVFPEDYMIRSSIGGLETSLGTQLWETLATEIAKRNSFNVHDPKIAIMQPEKRIEKVWNLMDRWSTNRNLPNNPVPLSAFMNELEKVVKLMPKVTEFKKLNKGDGVDLYISKQGRDYSFDIKTVQWNAGTGPKFNTTLMRWLTFHRIQSGSSNLKAHFVIPYDPTIKGWWHSFGARAYPLDKNDILVGDEFWNFISGRKDTLKYIENGFSNLATSELINIYKKLLTNQSDQLDIQLIEFTRSVKFKGKKSKNTISKTKKWEWSCNFCGKNFTATLNSFKKNRTPCSNFSLH